MSHEHKTQGGVSVSPDLATRAIAPMTLRYSTRSPFARKVMMVATELGIADQLSLQATKTRVHDAEFFADNPLAKIPVLITADGQSIVDSKVICEYLDMEYGGGKLLATKGESRWKALTWIFLADGLVDASLIARREETRQPSQESDDAKQFQLDKIDRGLDWFESHPDLNTESFDLKNIALACALEWLDLRHGGDFTFTARPRLESWFATMEARPTFVNSKFA